VETDKEAQPTPIEPQNEPPNGMYPARVDDKGRLKLPVGFQQYFAGLQEKKLFVTSLDRRIGQIYSIANWRETKKFLYEQKENSKPARRIAFNAQDLGADSEMDNQGRVLLPPEMRRELGIENQSVRLFHYKGRIEILSEAIYQLRKHEATGSAEADLETLEGAGLL
jgi:DNA-binding transcriptional regulator/RsmH inhibitor MraZ